MGQVARQFPTRVFDMNKSAAEAHAKEWGSVAATDLVAGSADATVVLTCLPNSDNVRAVRDTLAEAGAIRDGDHVDLTA